MKNIFPALLVFIVMYVFVGTKTSFHEALSDNDKVNVSQNHNKKLEDVFKKIELKTTKGTIFKFSKSSPKIVIFNFWASWCLPCLEEFPEINQFYKTYKDKVLVIGINGDEENPLKQISKMENKYKLSFESVVDDKSIVSDQFNILNVPATLVFSNGKLIFESQKKVKFTAKEFTSLIDQQLN